MFLQNKPMKTIVIISIKRKIKDFLIKIQIIVKIFLIKIFCLHKKRAKVKIIFAFLYRENSIANIRDRN